VGIDWLNRKVIHPDTGNVVKVRSLPDDIKERFRPKKNKKYVDKSYWLNKEVTNPQTGEKAKVRSLPLQYRNIYRPDTPQTDRSDKKKRYR
jgi:hypothetical protein